MSLFFALALDDMETPVLAEDVEAVRDAMDWVDYLLVMLAWQTTLDALGCLDSELL